MEQLVKQVRQASRRMWWERFLAVVGGTTLATSILAVVAVALPKWEHLSLGAASEPWWSWAWLGGALVVGILSATILTWIQRKQLLEAALEIDHRFGLKERISSTLSLSSAERETEAGRALIDDASRKISHVDVGERFQMKARWPLLLPIVPIALGALLTLLPNAAEPVVANVEETADASEEVKNAAQELRRRISERRQAAENADLREAEEMLRKLEEGLDRLASNEDTTREEALVELNELSEELEKRRSQLDSGEHLQRQMQQMADVRHGPGDDLVRSMQRGDFQKAIEQLEQLAEQMESSDMTEEQKEALAEQFSQMEKSLQQLSAAHQAAQEQLQQQMAQQMAQGDTAAAEQLQQQLDQLQQQNSQMQRLDNLADALSQCQSCLGDGNSEGAADQLNQLSDQLSSLQQEIGELEMIEGTLDQIVDCKNGMCPGGGQTGEGQGQQPSSGLARSQGAGAGQGNGNGLGEGQGTGARPLDDSGSTQFQDSQVQADVGPGSSAVVDFIPGPNIAGPTREEISSSIEAGRESDANPLTDLRVPRSQRDHVTEYFNRFREGDTSTTDPTEP